MRLALDTNTYTAFARGEKEAIQALRLADRIFMPIPVIAELKYGFSRGKQGKKNEAWLKRFLQHPRVEVLICDHGTTDYYAQLKKQLYSQGTPIPINDVWIASIVMQHNLLLFTYDSDFEKISQLPRYS